MITFLLAFFGFFPFTLVLSAGVLWRRWWKRPQENIMIALPATDTGLQESVFVHDDPHHEQISYRIGSVKPRSPRFC